MPKVSIIVPIYNVEKYLDRCMESLLNQTLKDIEIVMVDDGSPDNCPQMCDEYAKKDSRVKVVHKKNAGLGFARNSGLDIATGEYIAFVDSDDFTDFDAYRSLYETAQKRNADVVYAGFIMQHSDNNESECFVLDKEWNDKDIVSFLKSLIFDTLPDKETIWMSVWNAIYKREIIETNNIRFLSEREYLSEDVLFHTMLLPLCNKIVCIPKTFYHYCYNGTSLTHCNFKCEKITSNIKLYEKLTEVIHKYNLKELDESISLFFENYTRGMILKGIIFSNLSLLEKRKLCRQVYGYSGWEKVQSSLKGKTIPSEEKLGLFIIKHKAFLLNYLIYILYYKVLGKSKYEE